MSIRHASKDDCAAIAEIYNHAVLHTAAIWNDKTVDIDNRIARFEARQIAGYPVLVSEEKRHHYRVLLVRRLARF